MLWLHKVHSKCCGLLDDGGCATIACKMKGTKGEGPGPKGSMVNGCRGVAITQMTGKMSDTAGVEERGNRTMLDDCAGDKCAKGIKRQSNAAAPAYMAHPLLHVP